jgi:hypothetical protein
VLHPRDQAVFHEIAALAGGFHFPDGPAFDDSFSDVLQDIFPAFGLPPLHVFPGDPEEPGAALVRVASCSQVLDR